jgi:GT2 family glycosyltransferase
MAANPPPYGIHIRRGASVSSNPTTSIVTLVTTDTTMLQRCLSAVHATVSPHELHEVIVVANGTPDHALVGLEEREDIVLIRSPVNHGFAGGCNLAVRSARGARFVFLNDDATVTTGWLEGLHRALDADSNIAVAGSKVLLCGDRLQEAGSVLWSDGSTSGVGRGGDSQAPEFSVRRPVDYVSFCCAMVRRSAWEDAGGFDERYFPAYYEDLDLCLTLRRLGWKVMYEPASVVQHTEGGSTPRQFRDFLSRRNQAVFVAKWAPVLREYEDPPASEAERAEAVIRALRRAADRRVPARSAAALSELEHASHAVDAFDETEALVIAVRHLSAAVAVDEAYIRLLLHQAGARGVLDAIMDSLRRALVPIRQRRRRLSRRRSSRQRSGR